MAARQFTPDERRRARGALLGLAVGDALGTTLEFTTPAVLPFPARLAGPHRTVTGGGPFGLEPGEVTDDTQMACCIAASLHERSSFDPLDVVERYIRWEDVAFDVGGQTSSALGHAVTNPLDGGRVVWEQCSGMKPAGNGSLMRAAPIGVYFADQDARIAASWGDSSLTHYDPRCLFACVAFNGAVAAGVRGASVSEMLAAAALDLEVARRRHAGRPSRHQRVMSDGARDIASDLELATEDDPLLDGDGADVLGILEHPGFVRVAFRLAVWELVHAPSFEAGLVDVVNRGGDADTNGAIVGALLGARHGEDEIPTEWRARVLGARGLRPEYHPSVLLRIADEARK